MRISPEKTRLLTCEKGRILLSDLEPAERGIAELEALFPRYANFRLRAAAAVADLGFIFMLEVVLFWFIGWDWLGAPESEVAWRRPVLGMLSVPWLYETALTLSPGAATWGKRWAGIHVAGIDGKRPGIAQALLRHPAKYLTLLTLGIGFYVQPFTARKQALHDLVARTVVRER